MIAERVRGTSWEVIAEALHMSAADAEKPKSPACWTRPAHLIDRDVAAADHAFADTVCTHCSH